MPARAFDAAASPRTQAIDLMRVRCMGLDGRPVDRFGYLIVALGLAATISHRTSQSRWLKKLGEIAYLLMTPPVTLTYRQRDVSIEIDGVPAGTRRLFTAMIGNTENGGGGMKLLPGARFDDGVLDLIEWAVFPGWACCWASCPSSTAAPMSTIPRCGRARGTSFRFDSASRPWSTSTARWWAACRSRSPSCHRPSGSGRSKRNLRQAPRFRRRREASSCAVRWLWSIPALILGLASPAWADKDKDKGGKGKHGHGGAAQPSSSSRSAWSSPTATAPSSTSTTAPNTPPAAARRARQEGQWLPAAGPGQGAQLWVVGQPLPPAVIYEPLPPAVVQQLAPVPPGYDYVRVDNDVLLMDMTNRMVADVVNDINDYDSLGLD